MDIIDSRSAGDRETAMISVDTDGVVFYYLLLIGSHHTPEVNEIEKFI